MELNVCAGVQIQALPLTSYVANLFPHLTHLSHSQEVK
jgi:hypothetical protein